MKTALVTGAGKRLGRFISLRLAREGFRIAAHYNASAADAESLRDEIAAAGGSCEIFAADLSEPVAASRLMDDVVARFGAPSVLVNNASLFVNDDVSDFDIDLFQAHLAVNLMSPMVLARQLVRHVGDGVGDHVIINMLDNKMLALNPDFFTYTLSKFGFYGGHQMLGMRLPKSIRVAAIAPSVTLISGKQNQENFVRSRVRTPLERGPTPDEIADAVMFIQRTRSYRGQVLAVDGGQALLRLPRDVAFVVAQEAKDGSAEVGH